MINLISDLKNKFVLITGAGGNLGKFISEAFCIQGSKIILVDKKGTDLKKFSKLLNSKYKVESICFECNLNDYQERLNLKKEIFSFSKKIDILINNAAYIGSSQYKGWSVPFEDQNIPTWSKAIDLNLTANFHLAQLLLSFLKKSKNPNIINISSIHGIIAPDWNLYNNTKMSNPAAYSVSKAGLIHLTKWLSSTLAPKIRVNAIAPGGIFRNQPPTFVKKYLNKTPLRRMAKEQDIIGPILFLASNMSSYVTGQTIIVDGGYTNI